MKTYSLIGLFSFLSYLTFAQNSNKLGESAITLKFTGVPIENISGIDTSYQNALSVSPVLDLRTNQGWGITYSPSIVTAGNKPGIYMHALSAGFERYGKKSFDLAINYTHYFFTNRTGVPYSPINNEIFFSSVYTKVWMRPVLAASIGFGIDSSDGSVHEIGLVGGLTHNFKWEDKGIFSSIEVTPSVLLNAGTNGYFSFLQVSDYISHSKNFHKYVKKNGKQKETTSSLEISNLEINLETNFEKGSFSLQPTGSIFLPISSAADNTIHGYGEISLRYNF